MLGPTGARMRQPPTRGWHGRVLGSGGCHLEGAGGHRAGDLSQGGAGPVESPHRGQSGRPTLPGLARDILLGHFPCTVSQLRNLPERSQWFLMAF